MPKNIEDRKKERERAKSPERKGLDETGHIKIERRSISGRGNSKVSFTGRE